MKWTIDVDCNMCAELHNRSFCDVYVKQICDNCNVENRIVFETNNFVLIPSLGPVSDCHVLLLPKQHVNAYALLESRLLEEAEKVVNEIVQILKKKYGSCIVFEHGVLNEKMVGSSSCNHAHIHIVSCNKSLLPILKKENFEIREIQKMSEIANQKDRKRPYFYYSEDGEKAFIMDDTICKSQYMRIIASEVLDAPERGDWRTNLGIPKVQNMLLEMKNMFTELREIWKQIEDEKVNR